MYIAVDTQINKKNIILRRPRLGEKDLLTELSFRSKASWGYPENWLEAWRCELTVTDEMITEWMGFVVEVDQQIVGAWLRAPIESDTTSPGLFFISPEHMRQGYGRLLAEAVKQEAKRRGLRYFTLEADSNATAFYEKVGGRKVGEQASLLIEGRIVPIIRFDLDEDDEGRGSSSGPKE